ncbi:hypothetical protein L9F63_010099, partial [Diploptera punctata]
PRRALAFLILLHSSLFLATVFRFLTPRNYASHLSIFSLIHPSIVILPESIQFTLPYISVGSITNIYRPNSL